MHRWEDKIGPKLVLTEDKVGRNLVLVPINPVLAEKLSIALQATVPVATTARDVRLPDIPNKVHAVIGMRRTGKSTFLRQLLEDRRRTLPAERSLLISFEDDRLAEIGLEQLDFLLEEYFRRHPELRGRETVHWFLDEIQVVPGWERFLRRVLDTEKIELTVSGSSAKMLSREIHTSLRGRGIETVIRPFSFREYLRHRGEEPEREPQSWTAAERSWIEKRFGEFLVEGGFPETQGKGLQLRIQLLQGYVDTVLFRDIIERHGVTQVHALRWIVRHALRSPAGNFSVSRLHQDLKSQGISIGREAVQALFDHVSDAFLVSTAPLATDSERKRQSNPRKLYPADPGLIRAFDVSARKQTGHALETVVFNELDRRGKDVTYVRTEEGFEVDFLARAPGERGQLIQACADLSEPGTMSRELRALDSAAREHSDAERILLVLDRDGVASARAQSIDAIPAYEWLLAN